MTISASLFLFFYGLVIFIVFVFALFNIYHVVRYALQTRTSVVITLIFIFGLVLIAGISTWGVLNIDWSQSVDLININSEVL